MFKPLNDAEVTKLKKLADEFRPSMDKTVVLAWGEDVSKALKSALKRIGAE